MRREGMNVLGFESERIATLEATLEASEAKVARLREALMHVKRYHVARPAGACDLGCETLGVGVSTYLSLELAATDRGQAPVGEHAPTCLLGKYAYAGCTCGPDGEAAGNG